MSLNDTIKELKTEVLAAQTAVAQAKVNAQSKKNAGDSKGYKNALDIAKTKALEAQTKTEAAKSALKAAQKAAASANDTANFKEALSDIKDMVNASSNAIDTSKTAHVNVGAQDPHPNYQKNKKGRYILIDDERPPKENIPNINMGSILIWDENAITKLQQLRNNGSNVNWNNALGRTIICVQDIEDGLDALDKLSNLGHLQKDDDDSGLYD